MLENLKPDYYYSDIFKINLNILKGKGIKGIICDIDNTIVPWSEKEVLDEVVDWFAEINKMDFKICLVSNGSDKRVKFFSSQLGVPAVGQAIKPAQRAFKLARGKLKLEPPEIAVIGDQIFTDILGGNRMGFKTILVDPMNKKEFFTTRVVRLVEKLVFNRGEFSEF